MSSPAAGKINTVEVTGSKLDIACGNRKQPGFIGVDKYETPSTDALVDLLVFPWPWKSESIDEVYCSHFFEHIPKEQRPVFMEELYRILKTGAKATIICPYGGSNRAMQDFTHEWPPVFAESFLYFNKKWREENRLTHGPYAMTCDFDFRSGLDLEPNLVQCSKEDQALAIRHYINAARDLQITLFKR
ncbi:MAG: methyltransferase domain-containing protein [Sulfuricellaceae bacterium]